MNAKQQTSLLPPPPPPPRLPPPLQEQNTFLTLKTRKAPPPGLAFQGEIVRPVRDPWLHPPSGTYFFYGTLRDPAMLVEILDLPSTPTLRPAYLIGYEIKLWGQYPALVNGRSGQIVEGSAFEVPDEAAAEKLACYETDNYCPTACYVRSNDGKEPELIEGYTFVFRGNQNDLSEGDFDLNTWLKRMKRAPVES